MESTIISNRNKLTSLQKGILFDQLFNEDLTSYHIPVIYEFKYFIDKTCLYEIFKKQIKDYDLFQSHFDIKEEVPENELFEITDFEMPHIDLSNLSQEVKKDNLDLILKKIASEKFQILNNYLWRIALIKLEDNNFLFVLVAHQLIADGTSLMNIIKKLVYEYDSIQKNVKSVSKNNSIIYKFNDFQEYIEDYLNSSTLIQSKEYWNNKLSKVSEFRLKHDNNIFDSKNKSSSAYNAILDADFSNEIFNYTKENKLTIFELMQAAFVILLSKFTGEQEIIIGTPVSVRTNYKLKNIVGPIINTIFLNYTIDKDITIQDYLKHVHENTRGSLKHRLYPIEQVLEDLKTPKQKDVFPLTSVFFNGLIFMDENISAQTFDFFPNLNLDMNVDLNVYINYNKDNIFCRIDYRTVLFKEKTIEAFYNEYYKILNLIIKDSTQTLNKLYNTPFQRLDLTDIEELLMLANGTSTDYPFDESIATLIEKQVISYPNSIAIVCGKNELSYSDLNRKANELAHLLKEQGVKIGDFVALFMDKGFEIPIAMLACMKIGAPFVPIDLNWPLNRINYLIDELSPALLLFNKEGKKITINKIYNEIIVDHITLTKFYSNPSDQISLDTPIYGMYTSGTTGMPKCTVNIQKGILNRLLYMNKKYGENSNESVLFASKYDYDAGVWQLFWPLLNGGKTIIPTPDEDNNFHSIVELINNEQITFTDFVPSVFNVFVDYLETSPDIIQKVSSLRQLLIGGEAMNPKAIKRFRELLPQIRITNTYGATEASMGTIFYELTEDILENVPIGRPIDNVKAVILDDNLQLTPKGEVGDLYLGGLCLGIGYWNDKDKSDKAFIQNPITEISSKKLYRTGDLAKYLPDGNIIYIGRKDLQVKIRGIRIELSEIEQAILKFPRVKDAVVIAHEDLIDQVYLVAYLTGLQKDVENLLVAYLEEWLPDYMIPEAYVLLEDFPRISIGKVNKAKLKEIPHYRNSNNSFYEEPIDSIEALLQNLFMQILGRNIGVTQDFFKEGGDSLKAMQLLTKIKKEFGVNISIRDIFSLKTIRNISDVIRTGSHINDSIPVINDSDSYSLSHSQTRFWILSQFEDSSLAYNIPGALLFEGALDRGLLESVIDYLLIRHESLRTIFKKVEDGSPRQFIQTLNGLGFKLSFIDLSNSSNQDSILKELFSDEQSIGFDLSSGPLLRCKLIKLSDSKHVLFFMLHHIISDGWSMEVLSHELSEVYNALKSGRIPALSSLRIQYKDYSNWQNKQLESASHKESESYWLNQFAGELPVLNLPSDHPRPITKTHHGNTFQTVFSAFQTAQLKDTCSKEGATLFMGLLSLVNAFFYRYTGQQDIIIGTPIAGREHTELENQIGLYLNTLALRNRFSGYDSFVTLLVKVKEVMLSAYSHQQYQFDILIDKLNIVRDLSRSPLFDVMIVLQNQSTSRISGIAVDFDGVKIQPLEGLVKSTSQFDITFEFIEQGGGLLLNINYNSDIYDLDYITRLSLHLNQLLSEVISNKDMPIAYLDYLSKEERNQILFDFNDTEVDYPRDKTLVDLFEEQVAQTPEAIAVVYEDRELSYLELNERSNQLGHYLRNTYEIKADDLIGIMVERSEWMIIGMLGILKAGAAYVPIDPTYPQERIKYIIQDSKAPLILVDNYDERINIKQLPIQKKPFFKKPITNPKQVNGPKDLAYIIYTSGSTGKPKGVMIQHQNVTNLINWAQKSYTYEELEVVTASTSICFDLSIFEIFVPLTLGTKIILIQNGLAITNNGATLFNTVPSVAKTLIEENKIPDTISTINLAGEALRQDLVSKLYDNSNVKKICNLYAPSETTTYSTINFITHKEQEANIGKPIHNTQIYILDNHKQLQAIGIIGEIYIGGDGVAKGYLNKPELTAEKFIENPFKSGETIYKTGDLGKWLPDGNIAYIGRIDHQVKIRGFRIELGEIEVVLLEFKSIKDAIVITKEDEDGEKHITAYIVTDNIDIQELRLFLSLKLPIYMIPSYFIKLEYLPLTPNGKLDRKSLPNADLSFINNQYVAPTNEIEQKLVEIFQEILGINRVGITDNFFVIGGNSLKAVSILSRINDFYGFRIEMKSYFNNPTVSNLSEEIRAKQWLEISKNSKDINGNTTLVF